MILKIALLIPTYNRKNELRDILNDFNAQILEKSIELTTFVVVDGSTDGTIDMLNQEFKEVNMILGSGEWWYTRSINEGFRYVTKKDFDLVLIINDDCRIGNDYLQELIKAYGNVERGSIVGSISFSIEQPVRIIFSGIRQISWWRYKVKYYLDKGKIIDPESITGVKPTCSLPGRGMLIPTETLAKLGFFDESFIQYGSDSEFIFRATRRGINSYVSWDSKVFTYLGKTGKGSIHSREKFYTFIKNFFDPYSRIYIYNTYRILLKYGIQFLIPFTITVKVLGNLKNYLLKSE